METSVAARTIRVELEWATETAPESSVAGEAMGEVVGISVMGEVVVPELLSMPPVAEIRMLDEGLCNKENQTTKKGCVAQSCL